MYFYGSKLRSQAGSLDQRCGALEVSETKIAEATGIPLTTVRNYIQGEVKGPDQGRVDQIHRYLNSREYYRGYIFMPSYDFSKFIRKEVISVLKIKYQEGYMAKCIGLTKDLFSKLKNGKVVNIDIIEQHRILSIFYSMCRDENNHIADEFQPLHDKLSDKLGFNYNWNITMRFSDMIDRVCAQCERCENKPSDKFHYVKIDDVKAVLDKYDLGGEIEWLRSDNNFILDNELRCEIIDDLRALYEYGTFIVYDTALPWKFRDGFTPPQDPDLLMPDDLDIVLYPKDTASGFSAEAAFNAIRDHIYKYSDTLRALIFEHIFAFIEKDDGSFRHEYNYDSLTDSFEDITPDRKKIYNTDKPIFAYKADIMKEYRRLAFDEKEDVCHELSQEIKKCSESEDIDVPYFPLKFYYIDGTLAYDEDTGWSATVADIVYLTMMTGRVRTLRELDGTDLKLPYKVPEFNEYHIREALVGCCAADIAFIIEKLDEKLDYESIDWNFYALLSQAECIYAPLEHIVSYIRRLNRKDIEYER